MILVFVSNCNYSRKSGELGAVVFTVNLTTIFAVVSPQDSVIHLKRFFLQLSVISKLKTLSVQ